MIRGDDDLFSVMDEMSNGAKTEKISTQSSSKPSHRIRMLPEVDGYGGGDTDCPENGIGGNIWNPYVSVKGIPSGLASEARIYPMTNPYVEVLRRRAYEKFKKNFYNSLNWINKNHGNSNASKDEVDGLWAKLPPHSILERFHFSCKIEEVFQVLARRKCNSMNDATIKNDIGKIARDLSIGKEEGFNIDPILLSPFQNYNSSAGLLRNEIKFQFTREWKKMTKGKEIGKIDAFFASKGFRRRCQKISSEVNRIGIEIDEEFIGDLRKKAHEVTLSSGRMNPKGKKKGIPKLSLHGGSTEIEDSFSLTFTGLSFKISKAHFEKLQILYDRSNAHHRSLSEHQDSFYSALFALLARYDLLEGAGLQSSLNGNVFDVLLKNFECQFECFASPFNCRYERYCSAFADVDSNFGSLGSFFSFNFEDLGAGGCFQANPPFASDFILAMCKRMEEVLTGSSIQAPLMFIVFVPAWQDSLGWQALSKSPNLVHHLFLSQKDDPHFYCEGTQHRRLKGRYRIASFDTSVFFLQNSAAQRKWPITDAKIKELRDAFGSNPDDEVRNTSGHSASIQPAISHRASSQQPLKSSQCSTKAEKKRDQKRAQVNHRQGGKKTKKKKKLVSDNSESQLGILKDILG